MTHMGPGKANDYYTAEGKCFVFRIKNYHFVFFFDVSTYLSSY